MAKLSLYRKSNGTICLRVSNGSGDRALHSLNVNLDAREWDGSHVTSACPRRVELESHLQGVLSRAQIEMVRIQENTPTRNMAAKVLKDKIVQSIFHQADEPTSFLDCLITFAASHQNARTREIYMITRLRVCEYDRRNLTFDDITIQWLEGFDRHLARTSPSVNARAIHLRNIRAVFNYAIDEGITDCYPFRRYKIKREDTVHRDLTSEQLRRLFAYEPPKTHANKHASKPLDYAVKYLDIAKLMFCLIGINVVDLWHLKPSNVTDGRLVYRRAKTHQMYDIKLEPEAIEILNKYRGSDKLLSICENQQNYKDFAKSLNRALTVISRAQHLPSVTTYWIRHSWATIAYVEAHIKMDTISDCLGHRNGQKVTLGYVDKKRDQLSRDAANRAVLDIVFLKA